jgi:hypothetical protein
VRTVYSPASTYSSRKGRAEKRRRIPPSAVFAPVGTTATKDARQRFPCVCSNEGVLAKIGGIRVPLCGSPAPAFGDRSRVRRTLKSRRHAKDRAPAGNLIECRDRHCGERRMPGERIGNAGAHQHLRGVRGDLAEAGIDLAIEALVRHSHCAVAVRLREPCTGDELRHRRIAEQQQLKGHLLPLAKRVDVLRQRQRRLHRRPERPYSPRLARASGSGPSAPLPGAVRLGKCRERTRPARGRDRRDERTARRAEHGAVTGPPRPSERAAAPHTPDRVRTPPWAPSIGTCQVDGASSPSPLRSRLRRRTKPHPRQWCRTGPLSRASRRRRSGCRRAQSRGGGASVEAWCELQS